ncbi:carcinoembryonic antigen-related cell adhesion molecule 1-like [Zophobas morio]|uniref:carcinoembryonic antigen-related cell adhesion molecule 1-like n=1 Tax=Zophobas morio TaxID=2755281 RepID=UPI003083B6DB
MFIFTFHTVINKPICSITFGNLNKQQALICDAKADTHDVAFTWKANSSSGSLQTLQAITTKSHSFYTFNDTRPPSPAKIKHFPSQVLKKSNATLECSVDDPGFPKNLTFLWFRNKNSVHNSSRSTWNISSVSLNDRNSTFSCLVKNEAGLSTQSNEINLNIVAPPRFIQTPPRSLSVYYDNKNLTLTCRIECFPLCSIIWLKNDRYLDTNKSKLYYVETGTFGANYEENLFESVQSILVWNITALPGKVLNRSEPISKYTCVSSDSANIKSRPSFSAVVIVESAPQNLTVSKNFVDVEQYEIPSPVECKAIGYPLNYVWTRKSSGEVVSKSQILQLEVLSKFDGGNYTCVVSNKYGSDSVDVYFNVY